MLRTIAACYFIFGALFFGTVSAEELVTKNKETIKEISKMLIKLDVNKIVYQVCDKYTYFLNPEEERKAFPDKHYIIPSDDPLYKELVTIAKGSRHEYCDYNYSEFVEEAFEQFLSEGDFFSIYFPAIERIVKGKPASGDQDSVFEALDRSVEKYLLKQRKPTLEKYFKKVSELHERYWACESC